MRNIFLLTLTTVALNLSLQNAIPSEEREIPPAFGKYINLTEKDFARSQSFTSKDKIVGTYYFYWYNIYTKEHIIDPDGTDALTDHPADMTDFSYTSVRWHKKELSDMIDAGIDVVLPVFWGAPSEQNKSTHLHWSYVGIQPLVQAREELLKQGKKPPKIGLFYDTSTLQYNSWRIHIDLTTDFGRRWFYATVRDFFSMIPPEHWAMIDNKPIILLYAAAFAKNHDQSVIDFTKQQFKKEFGREPWIAREISWHLQADSTVAWGGALGLKNPGVASLGPGYDHSAVPGRQPLIVPRENGKFYEQQWLKFLRRPSNFVMVETWNEFHEGTDVCESKEYGRQYIQLTRKYADMFKKGIKPPAPKGKFSGAKSVSISLGKTNVSRGIVQIENQDGQTVSLNINGQQARAIKRIPKLGSYIYFIVDDSFKFADSMDLTVEVDYLDDSAGTLAVEYDGSDPSAPFGGAYTRSPQTVKLIGDKMRKKASFPLPAAKLLNGQNGGADLRLVVNAPSFIIYELVLKRN
ncbi:MAG: DUF5010 domain-containing protein [Verrucomicrobiia bacterium]